MARIKALFQLVNEPALALDLVRIYLGVGLFVRGAMFVAHPEVLIRYLNSGNHWFVPLAVSHYVALAHICGGLMLAFGLGTRVAAWVQVPPLLGAVFFVHWGEGLLSAGQSLEFAALVLMLLLVFGVFGAGRVSLDYLLEMPSAEPTPPREPEPRPARPLRPASARS